jgi:antitoxin ParD1/3/4
MARTITFQPSKEQGEFIEALITSGNYSNQSEVVRDGLRLLQEQQSASKLEALRRLIDEAENSPVVEGWNLEEFLKRMK